LDIPCFVIPAAMLPTDFKLPTRIVFGAGRISEIGELAAGLGVSRVLVVCDTGIIAAGHARRAVDMLNEASLTTQLFDRFEENPTTAHVEAGANMARNFQPDLIVGLGGGSSMDCAKGVNFLYSCGGRMQDYWGNGKATGPLLPMIAVPTTAGTGSETQSYALISDAQTRVKMACGDKRAAFRIAILDPELTLTQPPRVTALTGMDAWAHAIETYVTTRRNWVSQTFSREAWRHLSVAFSRVLSTPTDLEARSQMQLGACLAGLAIENSMLGAAHALANPLTAIYGIAHGEAIGLMLPHVIRFNACRVGADYEWLVTDAMRQQAAGNGTPTVGLAAIVEDVRQRAGLPSTLRERGVTDDRLSELAAAATDQWTGKFNPVEMTHNDYLQLYQHAF
jgi:alcohol dehydrogenase